MWRKVMGDTKEKDDNSTQEQNTDSTLFPFIDSLDIEDDIEQIKADERYQEF